VLGEAWIKDSSVTANVESGFVAWKDEREHGSKGICTIGDNVDCSGNNPANDPHNADDAAVAGGQLPGAPQERILVSDH